MKKRSLKNTIMILMVFVMIGAIYFTINFIKNQTNSKMDNQMSQINMDNETSFNMSKDDRNNQNDEQTNENMTNPPAKPDGDDMQKSNQNMVLDNQTNISYLYYFVIGIESLILAIFIIYLIMSRLNKKSFKETFNNSDKIIIYVLSCIILTASVTCVDMFITKKNISNNRLNTENQIENTSVTYQASQEINENKTITSGEFSSSNANENVILASGEIKTTLSNIKVTKIGDGDEGDTSSFYGNNSAILAKDGANLILKNISVTTNANGANGVFCYGGSATTNNSTDDGTTVTISDSTISATGNNSGGIMTTGGGMMKVSKLVVNTSGTSSAAIRTDRGGGTMTVNGGTYTTTGQGSPAIYSTANITVKNANLVAKASEGIVIEGANSVTINKCDLTDNNTKLNGQSTTYKNIFLYQSMSGDAAKGNAKFVAKDSNITTHHGDTFYITNTTASITLTNNTIVNHDKTGYFLRAKADSWGQSGSNGGNVTLVLSNQNVSGDIAIDSISELDMKMKAGSCYEGTINGDNTAKLISLTLDKKSKIKLTGDCYVSSLEDEDNSYSNIDFNGYKLYVNNEAIQ